MERVWARRGRCGKCCAVVWVAFCVVVVRGVWAAVGGRGVVGLDDVERWWGLGGIVEHVGSRVRRDVRSLTSRGGACVCEWGVLACH